MRPPARVDPESTHAVLGGEVSLGGATLAFWLAPSEPDPERQLFQARALRQRYSLSEGEPWRLRLEWRPPDAAQTGAAGAKLDLDGLRIVDDDGPALAPLNLARELDPLATLLAPPKDPLLVGTSLDLFLWGREPRLNPRLAGIQTPRESSTATAATLEVSLTSRALRMGDLVGPMARLDLPAQASNTNAEWKRAGAGASALPVQGTDDARY